MAMELESFRGVALRGRIKICEITCISKSWEALKSRLKVCMDEQDLALLRRI
jgi:hypothetical protein